ncbi:putative acyltransferase YihG [Saliniradius amylolyticus]|uniref:Putative acyltransferase YihG n=1 Tax=Saliniradius amylolyticus TaxID=2183582 RepID=A0A2S2E0T7_9ALTE|nr:acyltransferase [Saliniradius amylolyticus]AWL11254.1 putative acyltransferase YihG [Saliniradius amylolyticus]
MLSFLPPFLILPVHLLLQILNLAFWGAFVIGFGIIKFLLPVPVITRALNAILHFGMASFAVCSMGFIRLFNRLDLQVEVDGELDKQHWYLVISNHLSWLDIILLMYFSVGRIPATKFFIKQELLWMPFVGLGAWALDMPFMRRYSKEQVEKNPALKGKDIETTKKSCEKFKAIPTTVVNFVEGTRFTPKKHRLRNSPYENLLKPKAAGVAFTLAAMGHLFNHIINVTLLYPHSRHPVLELLCGRLTKVLLHAEVLPVEERLIGDYFNNEQFRLSFQSWLNDKWAEKDQHLRQLLDSR